VFVTKRDFPRIHFYNQDFVDIYDKTWAWIADNWIISESMATEREKFFAYPEAEFLRVEDAIYSSFFLVYSNRIFQAYSTLDQFYQRQEPSGAIRWAYNLKTGQPFLPDYNPEGVGLPVFAWAEFNLYHKTGNKKRIKDVLEILDKYTKWLDDTFKRDNGLYQTPFEASGMWNSPREKAAYLIDFNSGMAISALYMSALAETLNEKDMSFHYKQRYFALKTRINKYMWDAKTGFYYDIDAAGYHVKCMTLASFWPLVAEIPNDERANSLISKLQDEKYFGTEHPFPSLAVCDPHFSDDGMAYHGSVFPHLNFIVIKGLERYQRWDMARDYSIRHIYYVLDTLLGEDSRHQGDVWEAYLPKQENCALWPAADTVPQGFAKENRAGYLTFAALSTIALMVENVVGMVISLPKKTVDWIIPNLEVMGIENLSLKKNLITILSNKSGRGWEIHMESEKLYYFTLNIPGTKKKTLPIPSGKCSMLIDKL
jgi:neutral trehalase